MRLLISLALLIIITSKGVAQDTLKHVTGIDSSAITRSSDDDIIFTKTETDADYPGGQPAWQRFVGKNLHYPDDAITNEIQGTVIVQFIVDKEGNVSSVGAVSGPLKGGLREEAVRVLKLSGKWVPAIQNGRNVRAYKKQPFYFKLSVGK